MSIFKQSTNKNDDILQRRLLKLQKSVYIIKKIGVIMSVNF